MKKLAVIILLYRYGIQSNDDARKAEGIVKQ